MRTLFSSPRQDGSPAALFDRFSPIPGLLITSLICCTLLALKVSNFRGSEDASVWVKKNRTWVGITVQVASHILGIIHVQVLCMILRTSFVLSLTERSIPIYLAHFIQAASTPRLTWILPWRFCLPLLLIVIVSLLPAALWAGALTPLVSERNATRLIEIPSFDADNISALFIGDTNTAVSGAPQWVYKGLFSFDPSCVRGPLLASAAEASSLTNNLKQHAKLDSTGYDYINRSFGTGGTAGFTSFSDIKSPISYSYEEEGLYSTISCYYNESIADAFYFDIVSDGWDPTETWGGYVIQPVQVDPFTDGIFLTNYYVVFMQDSFAWRSQYDDVTRTINVQMITGADEERDAWAFREFNNIQCTISYTADMFDVTINDTSNVVTSSPRNDPNMAWPLYADAVLHNVSMWLWALSYTDGCVGGCQLGRSLRLNADLLERSTNYSIDTVLRATEDHIGSLTDNILTNLILARMVGNATQSTKPVDAVVVVPAIVIGDWPLIIVVVALNVLTCIIYTLELIRTRAWAGVPPFDLSNVCDIIIGAQKGGMLAIQSKERNRNSDGNLQSGHTTYSHEDLLSDFTEIQMRYDPTSRDLPALIPLLGDKHGDVELVDMTDLPSHERKQRFRLAGQPLLNR